MSITMSMTTFTPTDPLTWKQADIHVYVATRGGEFAGFVELVGAAYLAHDQRGSELGAFDSLDEARQAVAGAHRPPQRPSTFAFRLPRLLRCRPRRALA